MRAQATSLASVTLKSQQMEGEQAKEQKRGVEELRKRDETQVDSHTEKSQQLEYTLNNAPAANTSVGGSNKRPHFMEESSVAVVPFLRGVKRRS